MVNSLRLVTCQYFSGSLSKARIKSLNGISYVKLPSHMVYHLYHKDARSLKINCNSKICYDAKSSNKLSGVWYSVVAVLEVETCSVTFLIILNALRIIQKSQKEPQIIHLSLIDSTRVHFEG